MSVTFTEESEELFVFRIEGTFIFDGPTSRLNGNTAKDIICKGTKLEKRFETVRF